MHRTLTTRLLAPMVALAQRFSMRTKLLFVAAVMLVPLLVTTLQLAHLGLAEIEFTKSELRGSRAIDVVTSIIVLTQTQRSQTNLLLSGNTAVENDLAKTRSSLTAALSASEAQLSTVLDASMMADWQKRREALGRLSRESSGADRKRVFADHSAEIEAMRYLVFRIAEVSGLMLDPAAPTYLLMDLAVERVIPWIEFMGRARGSGAGLLARTDATDVETMRVLDLSGRLESATNDIAVKLEALARTGEVPLSKWDDAKKGTDKFIAAIKVGFGSAPPSGDASAFFATGSASIQAALAFRAEAAARLDLLLEQRLAGAYRLLAIQVGTGVAILLLIAYLLTGFYRATLLGLRDLSEAMTRVAQGDLSARLTMSGRDEIAKTGQTLEGMVSNLSELVAEVRSNSELIATTGRKMVADNHALAERTESQTRNLEESATSIRHVSETVAQNASSAAHASDLAHSLVSSAQGNRKSLDNLTGGMAELQQTSKRMNDILGAIDGIAFQTNILALNAAVEASRAGDHGRGFAVVAAEVRQLAQRCQAEASEIRKLIRTSSGNVDRAVTDLSGVRSAVETMLAGIQQASESMQVIAAGSMEQSASLEQVVESIGSLDALAQQNSDLVGQTSERSERLLGRAAKLEESVKTFRVRQGTATEARSMVERAAEKISAVGINAAIAEFQDAQGRFVDRDLYVFSFNRQGVFRLSGPAKEKVGKTVYDVAGQQQGAILLEGAWRAADKGGGWANYAITNPITGALQAKSSYICKVDGDWLIGCGFYVRDSGADHGVAAASPVTVNQPVRLPAMRLAT
jgi:methyl-accepting chemotaxis protein